MRPNLLRFKIENGIHLQTFFFFPRNKYLYFWSKFNHNRNIYLYRIKSNLHQMLLCQHIMKPIFVFLLAFEVYKFLEGIVIEGTIRIPKHSMYRKQNQIFKYSWIIRTENSDIIYENHTWHLTKIFGFFFLHSVQSEFQKDNMKTQTCFESCNTDKAQNNHNFKWFLSECSRLMYKN